MALRASLDGDALLAFGSCREMVSLIRATIASVSCRLKNIVIVRTRRCWRMLSLGSGRSFSSPLAPPSLRSSLLEIYT